MAEFRGVDSLASGTITRAEYFRRLEAERERQVVLSRSEGRPGRRVSLRAVKLS